MLIGEGIHQISGRYGTGVLGANVFLLVDNGLTLVDTGFKGRAQSILAEVKKLGYSPLDVSHIIITHHHIDHVGSLAALKKATGAKVIAHSADAPYINGQVCQPGLVSSHWMSKPVALLRWVWDCIPADVDMLIQDGEEIALMGGIKILHTPGHTLGSICLLVKREGLVIVGDLLSNEHRLSLPARKYTVDLAQEMRSISRLSTVDFEAICFGHGLPILQKARSEVVHFVEETMSRNHMLEVD